MIVKRFRLLFCQTIFINSLKTKGSEEMEEFTFRIYPDDTSGRARELITKQYAMDLDEAIEEATKILDVFEKPANVVFMIEYDGKDIAGISPGVGEWVKV